jgi:hypothetical protein
MAAKGWRRIGIVLSVIWFIVFGGYLWTSANTHISDFYKWRLNVCYDIWTTANESLPYAKPGEADVKYKDTSTKLEQCTKEASDFFMQQAKGNEDGIPLLIGVDLATVVVGWLIVWFVVVIVRWIGRGFASA